MMSKTWKIGYKNKLGEVTFASIQGGSQPPSHHEAAVALFERLSDCSYPGNTPESIQRRAQDLLESDGYTIVSIKPDDESN